MSLQDADTALLTGSFESPGFDQRAFADRVISRRAWNFRRSRQPRRCAARSCTPCPCATPDRASVRLSYEWQGPADAPVLLVAGGISAHRHVAGQQRVSRARLVAGAGRRRPRARYSDASACSRIDWVGADGSLDVADRQRRPGRCHRRGARRTWASSASRPSSVAPTARWSACSSPRATATRLDRLLAISGARSRASVFAARGARCSGASRALGRSEGGSREALSLARQLAMLSYRTPEEFAERFDAPADWSTARARCAAEDYLDACGCELRRAHAADRVPAPVRIDRPA